MGINGNTWVFMGSYGYILEYMAINEYTVEFMGYIGMY